MMDIMDSIKVEHIWSNNLLSQKSIAVKLGIWNSLSEEERQHCEPPDKSILNEGFKGDFAYELVYGEITKNGVFELNEQIDSKGGVFYDIGSGNGKLLLQMSIISNFDKYVGIEIEKIRHLYSIEIKNQIGVENVSFINEDVFNVDISDASFIFINDVMFNEELRTKIVERIPSGCTFVSLHDFDNSDFLGIIGLEADWMVAKVPFKMWIKK
jgi:hypothetical protein